MSHSIVKKLYLFPFLIFGFAEIASAQKLYLYSASDSTPIKNVQVIFKSANDKTGQVAFTNDFGLIDFGKMNLPLPVLIRTTTVGYQMVDYQIKEKTDTRLYLKPKANSLNEVVVTGQYGSGTIENSVHIVKVIDRTRLDQMGAQNLRDALQQSLNVRLSQDNILGSSMSLQGISGQDVKILIDGVPVIGRQNGNIDLSQINMNNVERIEIVEGPLSVNYGTDALAGTVNIITKKNQSNKYHVGADAYYESNGEYDASGKAGVKVGKSLLQLNFGRNYFAGWNPGQKPFFYQRNIKSDSSRVQSWKPKEQYFGNLMFSRKIKDLNLNASTDLFDENIINRGIPRPPYGQSAIDDRYKTLRSSSSLTLGGAVSKNYQINLLFSYNYYKRIKNSFIKDLTTLQQQLTGGTGDQDTTGYSAFLLRGYIASTKNKPLNYQVGYDIDYETTNSVQILDEDQNIGDFALFGTAQYRPVKGFIIMPGLRYAYNTKFNAPLAPSLNLKYQLNLDTEGLSSQKLIFRASYARGFRAPSIKELYFDFVDINHNIHGNPDLKAENSNNFIYDMTFSSAKGAQIFKVEWNSFYNRIQNMIVLGQLDPNSTLYTYANLGFYRTFGSNVDMEYGFKGLNMSLSGGVIGTYNQSYTGENHLKKYLYSPEMTGSIIYDIAPAGLSFALFYKFTGKLQSYLVNADGSISQSTLQSYSMADCSVSKSVWKNNLRITLGSKNLFNITNLNGSVGSSDPHGGNSSTSPLSTGRTYFLGLSLNLNYK